MRILWYSLGRWFVPSASEFEVVELLPATSDPELAALSSGPYAYFFEPTPHPQINGYDPIDMAVRLSVLGAARPRRVVAFASHPSPVPFEAQCAFASQIGHVLGVTPEIHRVAVSAKISRSSGAAKKGLAPDGRPQDVDPGPKVDWLRALDAAVRRTAAGEHIPTRTRQLVELYLYPLKGGARFSPTQRRLLHRASTGEISVIAEEIAGDLSVQLVTAQRAIKNIAVKLFNEDSGRRSPELVGRLVSQHQWFLRYNEF